MAKIYLIDSENVGDSWIQLLSSLAGGDRIYVFYTDKSPYISYESLLQVIVYGSIPVFIKCHEGRNALDFQLVTELGFKIAQEPSEEFIIVSDDNGFDAVVRYWSEKHYKVRRIGKKICRYAPTIKKDGQNEESSVLAAQSEKSGEPPEEADGGGRLVMERPLPVVYEVFQKTEEVSEACGQPDKKPPESGNAGEEVSFPSKPDAAYQETDPAKITQEPARPASVGEKAPDAEAEGEKKPEGTIREMIREIVLKCKSPQPEKDADCVYEMFFSLSMATLTEVNTALKIFIGNEAGNKIYRELKEHQECRKALDDLFLPTQKERFLHYVGIVLKRSELQDLDAEEVGQFLFHIPRKNLNSIRASMQKEFGHELGSNLYSVYKPHIKVLNKI